MVFEPGSQIQRIDPNAFCSSGLTHIVIPASVEIITKTSFALCRTLEFFSFEANSHIKRIEKYSLFRTSLTFFAIPRSLTFLHGSVFMRAPLDSVIVSPDSINFRVRDSFLEDIERHQIVRYFGIAQLLIIPRTIERIANFSCLCCRVEILTFETPSSVQHIEVSAFFGSKLTNIFLPNSIEVLGGSCFACCSVLIEVTFESNSRLREIESKAFNSTGLKKMSFPESLEIIGDCCFNDCTALTEIVFEGESRLREIGMWAFSASGLLTAVVPRATRVLKKWCFAGCGLLTKIEFEGGSCLEAVEEQSFAGCRALERVVLPNDLRLATRADRTENAARLPRVVSRTRSCLVS
jgi:hypothetical protein